MELTQLKYFVAVAEELHFSRAAARLHITQQPLSRRIQELEREVGARLFERTTRRVELTKAGKLLLGEIQSALDHLGRGVEAARRNEAGEVGQLALGYNIGSMYNVLPQSLRTFQQRFPGIWLDLCEEADSEILENQLLERTIDACFIARHPGLARPSEMDTLVLFRDPVCVVLPNGHPLSKRPSVPWRKLAGERFVTRARHAGARIHEFHMSLCNSAGFRPVVAQTTTSEPASMTLVAAGAGVALTSISIARGLRHDLICRPLREPSFFVDILLAWRRGEKSAIVQHLVEVTRQLFVRK